MIDNNIAIASWNCCLGLQNKLDFIKNVLNTYTIDLLFLQEAEIKITTPINLLQISNYNLEMSPTNGQLNSRTCCYVRSKIKYKRLDESENKTVELIMMETMDKTICGYYRPFLLPNHCSSIDYIKDTVSVMNNIKTKNIIMIGDFNIDFNKLNIQNYKYQTLYDELEIFLIEKTLVQIIKENTWQRKCKDTLKESLLDHIYTNDLSLINECINEQQAIGDHNLVGIELKIETSKFTTNYPKTIQDWSKYDKEKFRSDLLARLTPNMDNIDAQDHLSQLNQTISSSLSPYLEMKNVKRKYIGEVFSIKLINLRQLRKNLYHKYKQKKSE